jgi:hypothetical protein
MFLLSPLPLLIAILLFSLFSWPRISKRPWARYGRLLAIALFLVAVAVLVRAAVTKVQAGAARSGATVGLTKPL